MSETYNGVPHKVLNQAIKAKRHILQISKTIDYVNLGAIANLLDMPELTDWIIDNPHGKDKLIKAMDNYIAGRQDF